MEPAPDKPRIETIIEAASAFGSALFFSLLIITVSFLPIYALVKGVQIPKSAEAMHS